jgi:type I restriction enzyme S subunit
MSLPRYPSYKESGLEWLDKFPEHWEICRYKHIFKEREERSIDGDETLLSVSAYTGVSPRSEIVDEGEHLSRSESLEGYKVCYPDDLVMNIMLAWNRGLGFSSFHGIVSPAYCVFQLISDANPRFLDYMVRSDRTILYFKAFSSGVIDSRLRLYPDAFGSLYCGLPPIGEQNDIAAFLDRETGKIDALVEEQRRLLELLKEKRQAVISHAVIKGLNPDVTMKDSSVEWLGKVPAHWDLKRFGHLSTVVRGASPRPAGDARFFNGDFMHWITVGDLTRDVQMYLTSTESMLTKDGAEQSRIIPDGTLVLSNSGATLGVPKILSLTGCANDGVLAFLSLDPDASKQFLYYYLTSLTENLRDRMKQGSGQPNLNTDIVKALPVPWPAKEEQATIATHVEAETLKFDELTAEANYAIDLLEERRTALISAAVTGKIDVRGLVTKDAA